MHNAEIEDPDVAALLTRMTKINDFEMVISSQVLKALEALHPPESGRALLLRGVNSGSPSFGDATRGVAATNPGYVADDYTNLSLPPASYWCDREFRRCSLLDPLNHAFGGDHHAAWAVASTGLVLVRRFRLMDWSPNSVVVRSAGHEVHAWKCPPDHGEDRGERLVFMAVTCTRYTPFDLLKLAVDDDQKALLLCKAMYVRYLISEAGFRCQPSAAELLPSYIDRASLQMK